MICLWIKIKYCFVVVDNRYRVGIVFVTLKFQYVKHLMLKSCSIIRIKTKNLEIIIV